MAVHKNLLGRNLHKPKGIEAAGRGQVYIADGAGSGRWSELSKDSATSYESYLFGRASPEAEEIPVDDGDVNILAVLSVISGPNTYTAPVGAPGPMYPPSVHQFVKAVGAVETTTWYTVAQTPGSTIVEIVANDINASVPTTFVPVYVLDGSSSVEANVAFVKSLNGSLVLPSTLDPENWTYLEDEMYDYPLAVNLNTFQVLFVLDSETLFVPERGITFPLGVSGPTPRSAILTSV